MKIFPYRQQEEIEITTKEYHKRFFCFRSRRVSKMRVHARIQQIKCRQMIIIRRILT